jgi:uncharacterized OB-fold protein
MKPAQVAARDRFAQAAASGRLCLPVCENCGTCQYPVRDTCWRCLSCCIEDREIDGAGAVVATTVLHRSNDPQFSSSLPLRIASVRLDAGPVVLAFLPDEPSSGRVTVTAGCDAAGVPVLTAQAEGGYAQ